MKKIYTLFIVFVLFICVTGCGTNDQEENKSNNNTIEENETKKDEVKTENNNEITSIDDFENEVKTLGISYTKVQMAAEYVGAESGIKLKSGDYKLEIYKFDSSSNTYKTAEQNQKLSMEGYGDFDAIVKNGYAIMIDKDFPQYDKVIEIFNKLK